ncbi:hypothetical protein HGI47_15680 [Novosphingobium sp. ERN07]|uniref:hypothetical protein n=1 Tax=Novosphingobium sp. ERN07 TaxID=2726187 RepID=UPI0014575C3B|nr:hypothetical protein [Novosphingobium sp. ERN07]NLR72316.1 hypothetical protein [Novosphingobium sp. ERN07]
MANSPAHESDRILSEARTSLTRQQAGGRRSIGRRSAEMKRQHIGKKAARMAMAVGVLMVAAMTAGLVLDGIGFTGVMVLGLSIVAALWFFATFPKMKVPALSALNTGDVRTMVGRTELWLEAQRPALPAPAVQLVDQIGVQLDGLGLQLEGIDPAEPAVAEVRKLVGEHLPGMVESYRKIPAHLRREERGGRNADQQLADGLGKISTEIDTITRQLASGDLDALAVRGRFLDYRYGEGLEASPQLEAPKAP